MAIHDAYTEAEVRFLQLHYQRDAWEYLLEEINKISPVQRDKQSIICKASSLGLKRDKARFGRYTSEEDDMIRQVYNESCEHELEANIQKLINEQMPHRTIGSVQQRANMLGLRIREAWGDDEIDYIIDNYYIMSTDEIAKQLGRTSNSVYLMIRKLGLTGAPMYKYSEEDIEFIRENLQNMSDAEIGERLHRAGQSIKECRRKHGLYRRVPTEGTHYKYLVKYIQAHNLDWKRRSMEACGYKCMLTGGHFNDIHHLYSKNLIINTVLERLSLSPDIDINECEESVKQSILEEFYIEQNKHPLGVCLDARVHRSFHVLYGFGNNTPEQFYEFAKMFPQNSLRLAGIA